MDKTANRIFGLDLLRAIAISMVLLSHSIEILLPLRMLPVVGYPIGKLIALTYPLGVMGVELFFSLSGFLIGTLLIRAFIINNKGDKNSILQFWKMRWMRTLPAYYTVLFIVFLLNKYVYLKETGLSFLIFTQNFLTPHPPTFGEAWSLSIEEWSYIILPFLFWWSGKGKNKKRNLFIALCLYCALFVMLRIFNAPDPLYNSLDKGIRKVVLFRLDAVAWGILLASIHFFYIDIVRKNRYLLLYSGLSGLILISSLDFIGTHPTFHFYQSNASFRFLMNAFLYTLYPIFFAITIPAAYYINNPQNERWVRFISHTSILSYSLYLTHGYIILHLTKKYFTASAPLESLLLFIAYIGTSIISALILHRCIEQPFLHLREKIK